MPARHNGFVDARLEELRKVISEHPGSRAHTLWARLRRTHNLLAGNLRELNKLIDGPEADWRLALALVSNTGADDAAQEAFFDEFDRLLHNVVAASGTLIDHSRVVARRYEGTPFYDEYIRRVAEIGALPAAKFVKDLRNYMLHQSLPAPYSRVDLSPQKGDVQASDQRPGATPILIVVDRKPHVPGETWGSLADQGAVRRVHRSDRGPLRVDVRPVGQARRR